MIYNNFQNMTSQLNLDANENMFLFKELEHMKNRELDVEYIVPRLMQYIPVDSTTPTGAEAASYNVYDVQHRSKVISDYADDLPVVNAFRRTVTYNFKDYGNAVQITEQDVRNAIQGNLDLSAKLLRLAADSILRGMDRAGWFGDAVNNIPGWLSNTDVNKAAVAGANAAGRKWFTIVDGKVGVVVKTPDQILQDMNEPLYWIDNVTDGMIEPNVMVMSRLHYDYIKTTFRHPNSDTTILEAFQGTNPNITVVAANELVGCFADGNTKVNGLVVYTKDPLRVYQEIPEAFNQKAPQYRNLVMLINCTGRYGGVHIPYPASQAFRYGI